jgi:hypothetical protein
MNKIIEELLENNIPFSMETKNEYILNGFYKSGEVRLIETDGKLIAHARYNEQTAIEKLSDLVALNYDWWLNSRDRFDGWKSPESIWIPLLEKYGFIKSVTVTKTEYKNLQ